MTNWGTALHVGIQDNSGTTYGVWVSETCLSYPYSRDGLFTKIAVKRNVGFTIPSGVVLHIIATIAGSEINIFLTSSQLNSQPAGVAVVVHTFPATSDVSFEVIARDDNCLDLGDCEDDSDCAEDEKCVDGECVECDNQAATHFRLREEYSEIASIPGALVPYQMTALYPLPVSSPLEVSLENHNQFKSWWRIIFCDSSGNPAPYDGEFQINANNGYQFGNGNKVSSGNALFGPWDNAPDIGGGGNMYLSKVIVEFADESDLITEPDCSGITPESPIEPTPPPPESPPVEPPPEEPEEPEVLPQPSEPSPPDDWPEPWEPPYTPPINPIPPTEPTPPDSPSSGCECEIYLAQYLGSRLVWLVNAILNIKDTLYNFTLSVYDVINSLIQFLSSVYSNYSLFLIEFLSLIYQSVMYIVNAYQIEQVKNRKKISEVVDELKSFNEKFSEFADNYEPVTIENEYRTQSHRIIDNLDSTITKL